VVGQHYLQIGSAEIKCEERAVNLLRTLSEFDSGNDKLLKLYPVSVPSGTPVTNVGLTFRREISLRDAGGGDNAHHGHRMAIFAQSDVEQFVKVRSDGDQRILIESELLLYISKK
jgi:hypothetical protein